MIFGWKEGRFKCMSPLFIIGNSKNKLDDIESARPFRIEHWDQGEILFESRSRVSNQLGRVYFVSMD